MQKIKIFMKQEIVLILSFLLAFVSAFFVRPSAAYIGYVDFRTLTVLFCLMAVMEALKRLGVFYFVAEKLLGYVKSVRGLSLTLSLLCFFSSMLITNDVALITFVPFTVITLRLSRSMQRIIPIVVLETVAANLGSMLTPVGNPQNLYLFSHFELSAGSFFGAVFPYAVLSLILIIIANLFISREKIEIEKERTKVSFDKKRCIALFSLFFLALLSVFRVIHYPILLIISLIFMVFIDRKSFKHIDYSLLLTFVFLFIFIGNLGKIPAVSLFLQNIISGREVIVSILSSQIFSNVPAAVLLSGFTSNAEALLIGTNIGGLGTLIASMASLISFKFIIKEKVKTGRYLFAFTWINVVFLVCNLLLWFVLK